MDVIVVKRGKTTKVADGNASIEIPHTLGIAPTNVLLTFSDNNITNVRNYSFVVNDTNIVITWTLAPISDFNIHWEATYIAPTYS